MWPFKEKKKVEDTYHFTQEVKPFNVGKTGILVELESGETITLVVQGESQQRTDTGYGRLAAGRVFTLSSLTMAHNKLKNITEISAQYGLKDYRDPNTFYYSKPVKAHISWTEDFMEDFTVTRVVKNGVTVELEKHVTY